MTEAAETSEDFGSKPANVVSRWLAEVEKPSQADTARGPAKRLNLLWANTETLRPAVYSVPPVPDITRENPDRDPVVRAAAVILERGVRNQVKNHGFDGAMRPAVGDYLLSARGQAWTRYVPTYGEAKSDRIFLQEDTSEDGSKRYRREDSEDEVTEYETDDEGRAYVEEEYRPVVSECVKQDHVNWKNFGHTPAPCWGKVGAAWKKEMMTRNQLVERFGEEIGKKVALTKTVQNISDDVAAQHGDAFARAEVIEIWDKDSGEVIWISEGHMEGPLDTIKDPLHLEGFFPCPEPLYGTLTSDTLVPVADYAIYKDQADEVDRLTERIQLLMKAIRVVGVYDAEFPQLANLLNGSDNTMVAVDNWAMFAEKGGLKGQTDYLPIAEIAETLVNVINAREQLKRDIQELTGISDIIRGQGGEGAPRTATEQRIKSQYAGLRISNRQLAVNRFAVGIVQIVAEIVAEQFSPETLREISGWDGTDEARAINTAYAAWEVEREEAMQAIAQWKGEVRAYQELNAQGQWPQDKEAPSDQPPAEVPEAPPTSDEVFDAALEILRQDRTRGFSIEISTDAMVAQDQQEEQAQRIEFASTMAEFMNNALAAKAQAPESAPLVGELLAYVARGMKAGRGMEAAIETFTEAMGQPVEEEQEVDQAGMAKAAIEGQRLQLDAQQAKVDAQMEMMRLKAEEQDRQIKAMLEQMKLRIEDKALDIEAEKNRSEATAKMVDAEIEGQRAMQEGSLRGAEIQNAQVNAETDAALRATEIEADLAKAGDANAVTLATAQGSSQDR